MQSDEIHKGSTIQQALSVSQLNRTIRQLFDSHLSSVWVEGELSNLAIPQSGHWYFTLKDAAAQVRCAFFKGQHPVGLRPPESGTKILIRGRVSLYENRGDYQLLIERYQPAGTGLLAQAFEALKVTLEQEGLFTTQNKQPLPKLPKHVGVITSATGAALQDIITVLERRFPLLPVTVFPSAVQGTGAAQQLVNAIKHATKHRPACDVLIIGRGGGSQEDLWPFNEECVARALAQCPIPSISAVGHETDISICDFVADVRAPTPSAAAEMVSQDQYEYLSLVQGHQQRLAQHIQRLLGAAYYRLDLARNRLKNPQSALQMKQYQLHHQHKQLLYTMEQYYHRLLSSLHHWHHQLLLCSPAHRLNTAQHQLNHLRNRLQHRMETQLANQRQCLDAQSRQLHAVSPLATLGRGYALAQTEDGHILSNATHTQPGAQLTVRLHQGSLLCQVLKTQEH